MIFHYPCAVKSGWNFERKGKKFTCSLHRIKAPKHGRTSNKAADADSKPAAVSASSNEGLPFQHNLLTRFGAMVKGDTLNVPGNLDIGGTAAPNVDQALSSPEKAIDLASDSEEDSLPGEDGEGLEVMDIPLSSDVSGCKQLVRIERPSRDQFWNLSFQFSQVKRMNVLSIASTPPGTTRRPCSQPPETPASQTSR